jgi:hypothetical protein
MPAPTPSAEPRFVRNVVLKALGLFMALTLLYAALNPLPALGRVSIYNTLVPGRERLPFGEAPDKAYNLSILNVEAMFASHAVSAPAAPDEYRVFLIGDSSTWGFLLRPEETVAGYLNAAGLAAPDGRRMRFYNLGHPTISLTKDLLLLSYAMHYKPDMIIWLTTLEAFPYEKQLSSPIVQHNAAAVADLIARYNLRLDVHDPALRAPSFWERTIIGQRRDIADILRLNLYGVMWAATGIDQFYPESYDPPQRDFEADDTFYSLRPPLSEANLAFDALAAGLALAGDVPVLLVNEPIYISNGQNSTIRYNFFYPRWAYDEYRVLLADFAGRQGIPYLDLWDLVPPEQFTNSAIHVTPAGSQMVAERLAAEIGRD